MIQLAEVTLESEMDVVLSGQKFIKITDLLHMSLSTRSTFASAISEVVRVMTDHTDNGTLRLGLMEDNRRFTLVCKVYYPSYEHRIEESLFHYAKKLVPAFNIYLKDEYFFIEFGIGLPKSLNLDRAKVKVIAAELEGNGPVSPYEMLKISKNELSQKAELQEEELKSIKFLNDMKSEFISMASHELKTPITILKAYGQLALSEKIKTVDQVQSIVRKMNAQCTKLSSLALQLLDSAKIEVGILEYEMTHVDFNPYLLKTIEDLKHLVPHHHIVVDLGDSTIAQLDPLRMEQVLSNLLSNAAKYSDEGSEIIIKTIIKADRGAVVVSITDKGIGISDEGIAKIFDKFYREPEVLSKQSGLGMGMYIASKIIRAHGGNIWVESQYGNGSTFHVSLPLWTDS
jgi:signal transduction histidine kinase